MNRAFNLVFKKLGLDLIYWNDSPLECKYVLEYLRPCLFCLSRICESMLMMNCDTVIHTWVSSQVGGTGSMQITFFRCNLWRLNISQDNIQELYMVQYASFGNFCSNLRNFQNFDSAVIFNVMHYRSSYISINSCNTLDIYRMRCFLQVFSI